MRAGLSRRGLVLGLLAAPAIIRTPGLLMAIKPAPIPLGVIVPKLRPGETFRVLNTSARDIEIHKTDGRSEILRSDHEYVEYHGTEPPPGVREYGWRVRMTGGTNQPATFTPL